MSVIIWGIVLCIFYFVVGCFFNSNIETANLSGWPCDHWWGFCALQWSVQLLKAVPYGTGLHEKLDMQSHTIVATLGQSCGKPSQQIKRSRYFSSKPTLLLAYCGESWSSCCTDHDNKWKLDPGQSIIFIAVICKLLCIFLAWSIIMMNDPNACIGLVIVLFFIQMANRHEANRMSFIIALLLKNGRCPLQHTDWPVFLFCLFFQKEWRKEEILSFI